MNFKLFLLLATAFASTAKYMKIPVYWDDEDHNDNVKLINDVVSELSKPLIFYHFEQLSSGEKDEIPLDRNGNKAQKELRGFLHEFYRNAEEATPDFKKKNSPSFAKLFFERRNKTIWFGGFGFARSKTVDKVYKAMAIPYFYDSENKVQSAKAQKAIGTLEKQLEGKVTLWKFIAKEDKETKCHKSQMYKQGTILEVYQTKSEMEAKEAQGTGFKEFAAARRSENPAYFFGMFGFEKAGAKSFEFVEEAPPKNGEEAGRVTETTPLMQPENEMTNVSERQRFGIYNAVIRCCRRRCRRKQE